MYTWLAAIALLVALVLGLIKLEGNIEQRGYDRAVAVYEKKAVDDSEVQRQIEAERTAKQQEAQNESRKREELARADATRARGDAKRLRDNLDAVLNRPTSSDPAVIAERQTSNTLGNLFGQCVQRYTVLGLGADESREAGKLCEQLYDANVGSIRSKLNKMKGTQ